MINHANIVDRILKDGGSFNANDNISQYLLPGELEDLELEVARLFQRLLEALVIDLRDPNSKETALRLAKMYIHELMAGRYQPRPKITTFPNERNKYTGMLVIRAEIRSLCAHHHQVMKGVAYIGLIPNGQVMGLSKYVRLAQWVARRGQVQEELSNQIAEEIKKATNTEDVAVYVAMSHDCMENRGVGAHSSLTQTTVLFGRFWKPEVKEEFMHNIHLQEMHTDAR